MYLGRNSDGRLPFLSQLDFYAQHQVHFGESAAHPERQRDQPARTRGPPPATSRPSSSAARRCRSAETGFYQGIDTQALIAEQKLARDARFLMDSGYQAPLSLRLGVKVGF